MMDTMEPTPSSPAVEERLEAAQPVIVVGFWKRFWADLLDGIILYAVTGAIFLPLRQWLLPLGEQGVWIGLALTFTYVAVLHSAIGGGQTFAKRLLKIQVLRMDGTYLSVPGGVLRYLAASVMMFAPVLPSLVRGTFPAYADSINLFLMAPYTFIVTGLIVLTALHPQKRGLHDLIAGTVVVKKGSYNKETLARAYDRGKATRAMVVWITIATLLSAGFGYTGWKARTTNAIPPGIEQKVAATGVFRHKNTAMSHLPMIDRNGTMTQEDILIITLSTDPGTYVNNALLLQKARELYAALQGDIIAQGMERAPGMVADFGRNMVMLRVTGGVNLGTFSYYAEGKSYVFNKQGELTGTPEWTEADQLNMRGITHSRQGETEKALECYTKSLALKPDNPVVLSNMAAVFLKQGKYMQSVEYCNKALALDPQSMDATTNLGTAYHYLKDEDKAVEYLRRAARMNGVNAQEWLKKRNLDW